MPLKDIAKFSGAQGERFKDWLYDFEALIGEANYSESRKLLLFRASLIKDARESFNSLQPEQVNTLAKAAVGMSRLYDIGLDTVEYVQEIEKLERREDEQLEYFLNRIKTLVRKAYPESNLQMLERLEIEHFCS